MLPGIYKALAFNNFFSHNCENKSHTASKQLGLLQNHNAWLLKLPEFWIFVSKWKGCGISAENITSPNLRTGKKYTKKNIRTSERLWQNVLLLVSWNPENHCVSINDLLVTKIFKVTGLACPCKETFKEKQFFFFFFFLMYCNLLLQKMSTSTVVNWEHVYTFYSLKKVRFNSYIHFACEHLFLWALSSPVNMQVLMWSRMMWPSC